MDDFVLSNLQDSRNEWCSRLINILTPQINDGLHSIYDEAWKLCTENEEAPKYLMTLQNFLARVPKWNASIIQNESNRIIEKSGCNHLAELITCVHIIQLKTLTCMRVSSKQKKIDIKIPEITEFVHKIYIHTARKIYKNVYLFERNVSPLQKQRNNREIDIIIKECILNAIRESIPIEHLLKVYMDDEHVEEDTDILETEEIIGQEPIVEADNDDNHDDDNNNNNNNGGNADVVDHKKQSITFNDFDSVLNENHEEEFISAPKTLERLEEISIRNYAKRKEDEEQEDDDDTLKLGDKIELNEFDELKFD